MSSGSCPRRRRRRGTRAGPRALGRTPSAADRCSTGSGSGGAVARPPTAYRPTSIFHDTTLAEIAERKPGDWADLAGVPGVGPTKLERYADEVLGIVASE